MNKQIITDYILSGAKPAEKIGVELEHFIVDSDNKSVSYYGTNGVCAILDSLACFYDESIYSEGKLIALSNGRWHLTLEPAEQLEISIEPCEYISEIHDRYNEFLEQINPILAELGYSMVTFGYQPSAKVDELMLIPKKRYEFMDEYFKTSGKYGRNMMRGTASAQVSIDYTNKSDCEKKFRLANVLAPLLALISDNSPVFEGEPNQHRMIRTKIWNDVDNARCGLAPETIDEYVEYVLGVPAIFIDDNNTAVYTGKKTIGELYQNKAMTVSEVEHALSMIFPDVRLKQYIEIRPADSMPIEYTLSYAAFIKGIFKQMDEVCKYLNIDCISHEDIQSAKADLSEKGFAGTVYNKPVSEVLEKLLSLADSALEDCDRRYLNKIKTIVVTKKTLKEDNTSE